MKPIKRIVLFEYLFVWRFWILIRHKTDPVVRRIVGSGHFRHPWIIRPPRSPHYLASELFLALGKHKLDGGNVQEFFHLNDRRYVGIIIVENRHEKPGSTPRGAAA